MDYHIIRVFEIENSRNMTFGKFQKFEIRKISNLDKSKIRKLSNLENSQNCQLGKFKQLAILKFLKTSNF